VDAGLKIMSAMRGHTSGLALPTYVIDLPGGGGKVPISQNYVLGENEQGLVLHNFEGKTYTYPNPARAARTPRRRRVLASVWDASAGQRSDTVTRREQGARRSKPAAPARSRKSLIALEVLDVHLPAQPAGLPGLHGRARHRRRASLGATR
jgi:hypothetical protein